ncbi:hypothetical protein B4N89_02410 [Embleya scabrispora]|uniref:Uncharacterized protein n=1 Tax=Embleya scabrispora TaxID=159449 RepID=A0A1T3NTD9_9ACTN|nr:hypothetical protein [Embleya scabrispora]OPC79950.1 hypothetical protein B4N89_02410 [Embleya scabrispora]
MPARTTTVTVCIADPGNKTEMLMYFDPAEPDDVLRRIADELARDGQLVINGERADGSSDRVRAIIPRAAIVSIYI